MTERALLPTGLEDILPIDADFEASLVAHLMATFRSHGYDRVNPPLIEFEDSLLQGSANAVSAKTFRVMDPISQRMLGIRPDMTVQVDRIASTRLTNSPRPLRLSYNGEVLRVQGSQLRPARQLSQAGIELIGIDSAQADAEVIMTAARALRAAGVKTLTVDLGLPRLVPLLSAHYGLDQDCHTALRVALDRKDAAAVRALGGDASDVFAMLIDTTGPAGPALKALATLDLNVEAASLRDHLTALYELLSTQMPELPLTVDAVENRGYEYHTGTSYTFYTTQGNGAELGRGGRYQSKNQEPASGVTLFVDSISRAVPKANAPEKIYIPFGSDQQDVDALRAQGHICLNGLEATDTPKDEAKRLGCQKIYLNNTIEGLDA